MTAAFGSVLKPPGYSTAVHELSLPAAAATTTPWLFAYSTAVWSEQLGNAPPRLRLMTCAPPPPCDWGFAAQVIPLATSELNPEPWASSTRTAMMVALGAPPRVPLSLSLAPAIPAVCVPCPFGSPLTKTDPFEFATKSGPATPSPHHFCCLSPT